MASSRRWLEIAARSASAGDRRALLADALLGLGGRAIEERDGWFVTHVAPDPEGDLTLDGVRYLLTAATGIEDVTVRVEEIDHENWAETWRRGLAFRRVSERIVVRPSWIEPEPLGPDDIEIVIDPGMAFGTAEHGTTRGCLRLLDGRPPEGGRLLDVGAGSGILAIAMARLGATTVVAVEGDTLACEALRENVDSNGVGDRVEALEMWLDADGVRSLGGFDAVAANLETGLLVPLLPALAGAVSTGGWLLLSGILDTEWTEVVSLMNDLGWRCDDSEVDDGWRSGRFMRRV